MIAIDGEYGPGRAVSLLEEDTKAPVGPSPTMDGMVQLSPFEVLTLRYAALDMHIPSDEVGREDRESAKGALS
jgi:hypothetical protein